MGIFAATAGLFAPYRGGARGGEEKQKKYHVCDFTRLEFFLLKVALHLGYIQY